VLQYLILIKTVLSCIPYSERPMTPFESLLWNIWLPKVRSCINNNWSPQDPHPAVRLYEAWSDCLPQFIRDNFLDQLILPKVQRVVADWNPKMDSVALQTAVFPWLPHLGLRLDDVLGDVQRKVSSLLRGWVVVKPIPSDLVAWKEVLCFDFF
jgi:tuftelin-interacting protein 11